MDKDTVYVVVLYIAVAVLTFLALLLQGCLHTPAGARLLAAEERALVEHTRAQWDAEGLSSTRTAACDEALDEAHVVLVDDAETLYLRIGACPPGSCSPQPTDGSCRNGCAAGALVSFHEGLWPFGLSHRIPLFVLWAPSAGPRLWHHEAVHLFEECTARTVDVQHADPRLWCPNGVACR